MPTIRSAARRKSGARPQNTLIHNEVLPHQEPPPAKEEDLTAQELAEIEWILELMSNAEGEMGCDYPDGPMSPNGCRW